MKSSINYFDEAKKSLQIKEDAELCEIIGTPRSSAANWRSGRNVMSDYAASKLADLLDIDHRIIISVANAERERDEKKKQYWRELEKKVTAHTTTSAR